MNVDELLAKLGNARQLIFEVEEGFKEDEAAAWAKNQGMKARERLGYIEHELLIRKGIRSR